MRVRLTINIGTRDAEALGLRHTTEGSVVDVSQSTASVLIAKGWAMDARAGSDLRAVPPIDLTTADTAAPAPAPRGRGRPRKDSPDIQTQGG